MNTNNKIAFFTIATNNYINYAINLAKSIEKYAFVNNSNISFIIFSNHAEIKNLTHRIKTKFIHVSHIPFPMISIMRYEYYLSYDCINEYDYIYHIDCDMLMADNIDDDILSERVCVKHPGMYTTYDEPKKFPYERNNKSKAYVPYERGIGYYQNCFQGGNADEFIKMSKELKKDTEDDLNKNYIPFVHDESYMNRYMVDNPPTLVLQPTYAQPQLWPSFGPTKIIHICKDKPPHNYYNNI